MRRSSLSPQEIKQRLGKLSQPPRLRAAPLRAIDPDRPWLGERIDARRINRLRAKTHKMIGGRGRIASVVFFIIIVANFMRACFEAPRVTHTLDDMKPPITGH
jgi:hypothetical protein